VAIVVTAAIAPCIERSDLAESGFARIVEQFLRQSLEDSDDKRRRARALRGRLAMTASDYEQTITLAFAGDSIAILDGALPPLDATISGPYQTLVNLLRGEDSPLLAHLRRRIRVRSNLRKPFFPLHVHNLMKLDEEAEEASGARLFAGVREAAIVGTALVAAFALLTYVT
jgi:putative sterol carrier protein